MIMLKIGKKLLIIFILMISMCGNSTSVSIDVDDCITDAQLRLLNAQEQQQLFEQEMKRRYPEDECQ